MDVVVEVLFSQDGDTGSQGQGHRIEVGAAGVVTAFHDVHIIQCSLEAEHHLGCDDWREVEGRVSSSFPLERLIKRQIEGFFS